MLLMTKLKKFGKYLEEVIFLIQVDNKLQIIEQYKNELFRKSLYENRKGNINCCPICGHNRYIKYGFYEGVQRYKCKNQECNKTFSLATGCIWSYSKKGLEKWCEFLELMVQNKTLRACAFKLNINLVTAFYWRHKIIHAMTLNGIPTKLCGNVHMTTLKMKENFKGSRNILTTERKNIWIISASSEGDLMLSLPICKDIWSIKEFNKIIYPKINKTSYIKPYYDRYIYSIAKRHNKNIVNIEESVEWKIQNIRGSSSIWFERFHGIATKYLKEYLCWFIISYKNKVVNSFNIIYELAKEFTYISTKELRIQ